MPMFEFSSGTFDLVDRAHMNLRNTENSLAVAESCTGGLLGGAITAVAGSSDVFDGGVIAYSNWAKRNRLNVDTNLLEEHGAVSRPVARAMVKGLSEVFSTSAGISITGIAGPDGGTEEKPVGLVYFGMRYHSQYEIYRKEFDGDRQLIRAKTVNSALEFFLESFFDGTGSK